MEREVNQSTESTATIHRQNESVKADKQEQTVMQKIRSLISLITIEPALLLYLFSSSLATTAKFNMTYEIACRANRGLADKYCSNITDTTIYSWQIVDDHHAWSKPIQTTIMTVVVLSFASFSDRYKIRKPFFVIPFFGEVFSYVGLILCAIFINQWPVQIYLVLALLLPSLFGGGEAINMGIYSYITDISTQEERTSRIGFVEIVSLIHKAFLVSGLLFTKVGYFGVYAICLILHAAGALYAIIFVKEKRPASAKFDNIMYLDLFDLKIVVVDTFKILFRKRIAYRRPLLFLTYVCYILIKGIFAAEVRYMSNYIFYTLKWSVESYKYYQAFDITVHVIGILVAVTIFTKKFKLNDIVLAVIACIVKLIVGLWYAFGVNSIMFILGSLISLFSGIFVMALRAFVSKLVKTKEIAKAQALFAICEPICPIIFSWIYYQFNEATSATFPRAFFLFSSALIAVPLLVLLGMNVLHGKDIDNPEPVQENVNEENVNETEIEGL